MVRSREKSLPKFKLGKIDHHPYRVPLESCSRENCSRISPKLLTAVQRGSLPFYDQNFSRVFDLGAFRAVWARRLHFARSALDFDGHKNILPSIIFDPARFRIIANEDKVGPIFLPILANINFTVQWRGEARTCVGLVCLSVVLHWSSHTESGGHDTREYHSPSSQTGDTSQLHILVPSTRRSRSRYGQSRRPYSREPKLRLMSMGGLQTLPYKTDPKEHHESFRLGAHV